MVYVGFVLLLLCRLYMYLLIARMIISWIPLLAPRWNPPGIIASLFEIVYTLTDPPIRFVRRFIPPLPLGGVSLDLGFIVVWLGVYVISRVIVWVFYL